MDETADARRTGRYPDPAAPPLREPARVVPTATAAAQLLVASPARLATVAP